MIVLQYKFPNTVHHETCKATGNPVPMVEWQKSDGTLRDYIVSNNHYAVFGEWLLQYWEIGSSISKKS